ncbi:hypothetical protein FQA39_LY11403 [Lamprigera yunnana]|nr:hypothetical protein FQA39_LY11403 [Lamprigera yunnana]
MQITTVGESYRPSIMFEVEKKVVLVTGGAGGIGLACVKAFLKNGAKGVAMADVNNESGRKSLEEVQNEFGTEKVIFIQLDVSDKTQFENAFKTTIETFNNLDIVVNNAGILNEKQWERTVAVNLNGVINGTMLAFETYIPKYRTNSEGVIINIASNAGVYFFGGFAPVYTATKHAVIGLSRSLGLDIHYQRKKVKVISICPGATETNMQFTTTDTFLNDDYSKLFEGHKDIVTIQSASYIAENIINIVRTAKTGSAWFIEDYETCEIDFPSKDQLRKKSA